MEPSSLGAFAEPSRSEANKVSPLHGGDSVIGSRQYSVVCRVANNRDYGSSSQSNTMKNLISILLGVVLCGSLPSAVHGADSPAIQQAIAVLHPTAGQQCHGIVRFIQEGDSVKVVADIEGLTPNQKHAFHIHQYGDCSAPDGMSAGGHYNPQGHQHGLPDSEARHAGDLGNLQADAQGKAHYELTLKGLSIQGSLNPILGRGVIVHAKLDDGGQPVGNAGGRIACGVIGVANPGK
jgi:superoxide dismutase, Cu-Zn family